VKSQIYQIASVLTIVLSLVPALIVTVKKLWRTSPFQLFAVYWLLNGLVNTAIATNRQFKLFSRPVIEGIIVVYNTIDVPLMAVTLFMAVSAARLKRMISIGFGLFIAYELFCLLQHGLRYEALKYAMGIGVIMLMAVIVWEIILLLRPVEYAVKEKAMLFILGSLLFQYGMYMVVYVFDYAVDGIPDHVDKFLIYYTASIISLSLANYALLLKDLRNTGAPPASPLTQLKKTFWGQFREKTVQ